eukprot:5136752-Alexandrium_andersonii.AAC.1
MGNGAAVAPIGASGAEAPEATWSSGPAPTRSASRLRPLRMPGVARRRMPARPWTPRARRRQSFATWGAPPKWLLAAFAARVRLADPVASRASTLCASTRGGAWRQAQEQQAEEAA